MSEWEKLYREAEAAYDAARTEIERLKRELADLRWHWERVASHVFPGQQDTVETVLAMLSEAQALRELAERRKDLLERALRTMVWFWHGPYGSSPDHDDLRAIQTELGIEPSERPEGT